jgi:hypothetical protein
MAVAMMVFSSCNAQGGKQIFVSRSSPELDAMVEYLTYYVLLFNLRT